MCQWFVANGADRSVKNHEGWTPAHTAVYWAQGVCLSEVLKSKDDICAKNKQNETLKEMATRLGHKRVVPVIESCESIINEKGDLLPPSESVQGTNEALGLDIVNITVSGKTFVVSKRTLEVIHGSYFWMMLHPTESVPDDHKTSQPGFGLGPGKELKRLSNAEFILERDPNVFSQILSLLRGLKYSNLK